MPQRPEAEVVRTPLKTTPAFVGGGVDLVYMCSMTESAQPLAADALRPHVERMTELIDGGTVFLMTGNALEIFVRSIEDEDGGQTEMLGLFDFTARRRMMKRHNSLYLGNSGRSISSALKASSRTSTATVRTRCLRQRAA